MWAYRKLQFLSMILWYCMIPKPCQYQLAVTALCNLIWLYSLNRKTWYQIDNFFVFIQGYPFFSIGGKPSQVGGWKAEQRGCPKDAMGGVGGQDWELDSFHAHCCKETLLVFMLYFLVSNYVLCRLKSCLLEKEESVIKYLKGLILSSINALLNVLLVVSPCFLVLGMQLPEAKGHLRSYLCFWTCMR